MNYHFQFFFADGRIEINFIVSAVLESVNYWNEFVLC